MCALQTLMRTRILYLVLVFRCPASLSQTMHVGALAMGHFDKTRKAKYTVTRAVVTSFGRSGKKTVLASPTTSAADKERLDGIHASERSAKNLVVRNGLASKRLHGEAGSVNPELVAKGIEEIREECRTTSCNVYETSIQ